VRWDKHDTTPVDYLFFYGKQNGNNQIEKRISVHKAIIPEVVRDEFGVDDVMLLFWI
jgi:hypothetical protein